ncbi:MAG: YdeI/OmpD-associated family protein [Planctomycetota bacterium]
MFFTHQFVGTVDALDFGRMIYRVAFIPSEIADDLPLDKFPRLRVDAEVSSGPGRPIVPLNAALMPAGGRRYLLLSKRTLQEAGLGPGDPVTVRLCVADQDAVDVPEDLHAALSGRSAAADAWEELSPGRRRSFVYRVDSAVREETRARRIAEVIAELLGG